MKQEQVAMHVKKLNIPRLNLKKNSGNGVIAKWSEMIDQERSCESKLLYFKASAPTLLSPRQRQIDVVTHSFNYWFKVQCKRKSL